MAYFYFSFRDDKKQKAINLLSSTLMQLVLKLPTIPESILSFHQNHQYGRPPRAGLYTAIKSLLTKPTFIIIDALDECPEIGNERKYLCEILAELHKWNVSYLHILVTSRKEQDINAALSPIVTSTPISITEEVAADIQRYVSSQVANDPDLNVYGAELKMKIERNLVEKANGM